MFIKSFATIISLPYLEVGNRVWSDYLYQHFSKYTIYCKYQYTVMFLQIRESFRSSIYQSVYKHSLSELDI